MFILTNVKIKVSFKMMEDAGLLKVHYGNLTFGVPNDPFDLSKGVQWKRLASLTEMDFECIEDYFLNKKA